MAGNKVRGKQMMWLHGMTSVTVRTLPPHLRSRDVIAKHADAAGRASP